MTDPTPSITPVDPPPGRGASTAPLPGLWLCSGHLGRILRSGNAYDITFSDPDDRRWFSPSGEARHLCALGCANPAGSRVWFPQIEMFRKILNPNPRPSL